MDETRLVSRLAELTGFLSPAEGTPPAALDQARRLLAEALLNSQSEPMEDPSSPTSVPTIIETLPPQIVHDLRRIAHDAIPAQRDPSLRIFRRAWPASSRSCPTVGARVGLWLVPGVVPRTVRICRWRSRLVRRSPYRSARAPDRRPDRAPADQLPASHAPCRSGRSRCDRPEHSRWQRLACGSALRLGLARWIVCRPSCPRGNAYAQPLGLHSREHNPGSSRHRGDPAAAARPA